MEIDQSLNQSQNQSQNQILNQTLNQSLNALAESNTANTANTAVVSVVLETGVSDSRKKRRINEQDEHTLASTYKRLMTHKNEYQRKKYQEKASGNTQIRLERLKVRNAKRHALLEYTLYKMAEDGVDFTGNNSFIQYIVNNNMYTTSHKNCHINSSFLTKYRKTMDINNKLLKLKALKRTDLIQFSKEKEDHLVKLSSL